MKINSCVPKINKTGKLKDQMSLTGFPILKYMDILNADVAIINIMLYYTMNIRIHFQNIPLSFQIKFK